MRNLSIAGVILPPKALAGDPLRRVEDFSSLPADSSRGLGMTSNGRPSFVIPSEPGVLADGDEESVDSGL
jgi:hypothetical protein